MYHEREVLSQQSLDQMLDFLLVQDPAEPLVTGYGLGVVEFSPELLNGLEVWGHAGNAPGYAAGTLYLPDYGVSIALATNTQEGEAMQTVNDLLSIVTSRLQPAP